MSIEKLPLEISFLIFKNLLNEYEDDYTKYRYQLLKLRLTSKYLNQISSSFLFKHLFFRVQIPRSWMKITNISQTKDFARHVRILVIYIDWLNVNYGDNKCKEFDLALLPNLAKINICWGFGYFGSNLIRLCRTESSKSLDTSYRIISKYEFWRSSSEDVEWQEFASLLIQAAIAYGYRIDRLRIEFPTHTWKKLTPVLSSLDLGQLHKLRLGNAFYKSAKREELSSILLSTIECLPSLVYLTLQDPPTRVQTDNDALSPRSTVAFLENQHWPSLRHMRIEFPRANLATLQAFLLLYQHQLETLHLHSECPYMSLSDLENDGIEASKVEHEVNPRSNVSSLHPNGSECSPVLKTWIKYKIAPLHLTTTSVSEPYHENDDIWWFSRENINLEKIFK